MRILSLILALALGLFPVVQAYGKTLAEAHCRANGHVSVLAADPAHDPLHAQHHGAEDASAHQHHGAGNADTGADAAHCQCGCLCATACAGGAAVSASFGAATAAPQHEPWLSVTDPRHPVTVHDSPLRPPRIS